MRVEVVEMNVWREPRGREIEKIYRNRPRKCGKKAKRQSQSASEDTKDTIVQRQAKEAYQIRREFVKEFKGNKHSHRALITAASCYVEWMLNYIVKRACKTGKEMAKKQHIGLGSKAVLLYELGIINEELYKDIKELIKLRNKAVHNVKFQISRNDVVNFDYFKKADKHTQNNLKKKENAVVDVVGDILSRLETRYQDYVWSPIRADSD